MKRQVLCFSVHRELLCWTNIFQDPGTLFSVKSSQECKKPLVLLILEPANKGSSGCLCLGSAQPTVLALHCVCAHIAECSWQEDDQTLQPEGKGDCTPSWDQGTSTNKWHSVDLVHSGHLHVWRNFSWSVRWVHPAQKNVYTCQVEKLWRLVTLVCYPCTGNEAG